MPIVLPPSPIPARALRVSFVLGAVVDLSGGIPLLLHPEWMSKLLGAPVDGMLIFWPSFTAVFLFVLPVFYLVSAINPTRLLANVAGVIVGRLLGAVAYLYWWTQLDRPVALLGLCALNFAFAVHNFTVLGTTGRALLRTALRVSDER